jgi:hypothetical protein
MPLPTRSLTIWGTICCTTWYARSYGNNRQHTARIDAVFAKAKPANENLSEPTIFKDKSYALKKKIAKFYRRIVNKINK